MDDRVWNGFFSLLYFCYTLAALSTQAVSLNLRALTERQPSPSSCVNRATRRQRRGRVRCAGALSDGDVTNECGFHWYFVDSDNQELHLRSVHDSTAIRYSRTRDLILVQSFSLVHILYYRNLVRTVGIQNRGKIVP